MTAQLRARDQRAPLARELAARYRAGESIRTIATDLGRSYCYVHRLLHQAGVTFRGRGGNNNPKGRNS